MTITVLLFADLAEAQGATTLSVEVPAEATAGAVLDRLAADHPAIATARPGLALAVGDRYVNAAEILRPGDELALISPVSGG